MPQENSDSDDSQNQILAENVICESLNKTFSKFTPCENLSQLRHINEIDQIPVNGQFP